MKVSRMETLRRMALTVVLSGLLGSTVSAAAADHELKLIPSNTHTGSFDARIKPVLRIAPATSSRWRPWCHSAWTGSSRPAPRPTGEEKR
jgi:hypothetical protein